MNKVLGIVTARYGSTRFLGKPLVDIGGLPMIHRTYNQALKSKFDKVIVATDDWRILDYCNQNEIPVIMTSVSHNSGTERCVEIISHFDDYDFVVNIQGDEPFIAPETLNLVIDEWKDNQGTYSIITPIIKLKDESSLFDRNTVKVVLNIHGQAMYFSRSAIPFNRDRDNSFNYWKHLGVYGYSSYILKEITKLKGGTYFEVEKLEQLKWLEHGYQIKCVETIFDSDGIDTREDLEKVVKKYSL